MLRVLVSEAFEPLLPTVLRSLASAHYIKDCCQLQQSFKNLVLRKCRTFWGKSTERTSYLPSKLQQVGDVAVLYWIAEVAPGSR
ncbi:hypothetical protein KR51_00035240 [Rubidibacter lacunae KORDI 51-2]|uniref:Uncharacterized protein n=1 Tax=Rubidibacter lacunae KORDI 51-2 TaxID=582515 RepID=U5DEJ3_9CHRO|nr:hypothetical protein KR51_00035240 [Rubidibacter lacunae KORDI 51-2]